MLKQLSVFIATLFPISAMAEDITFTRHSGHFVVVTPGKKKEQTDHVFSKYDDTRTLIAKFPKSSPMSNPVTEETFEEHLVIVVVTCGDGVTSYSDVKTSIQDGVVTLSYKWSNFGIGYKSETPLVISVPKKGVKSVNFVSNGKDCGELTVKK